MRFCECQVARDDSLTRSYGRSVGRVERLLARVFDGRVDARRVQQ